MITLEDNIIQEKITIDTDPELLKQIIDNLLSNAIKYSFNGTKVKVLLEKREQLLLLKIIDAGPGFSKSDMAKIFGKFQRLSAKPTGGEDSVGLGLFIVKKICDILNIDIRCESEFGKGATFILTIKI